MAMIRWTLIAMLFLAWTLPTTGLAAPAAANGGAPAPAQTAAAPARTPSARPSPASAGDEAAGYAAREQQSSELQNYQGGAVVIYLGTGVLLVAVLVLLLLLV